MQLNGFGAVRCSCIVSILVFVDHFCNETISQQLEINELRVSILVFVDPFATGLDKGDKLLGLNVSILVFVDPFATRAQQLHFKQNH